MNRRRYLNRGGQTRGKGFWQLKDREEQEISSEEIEHLYSEEAPVMVGQYPNTWCTIVAEDTDRSSQAKKGADQILTFESRSDYLAWRCSLVPSLILIGHKKESKSRCQIVGKKN